MKKFNDGLYIPIVTPFTEEGHVNEDGLRSNIHWYLELGVPGIICTGSNGSFDALSDEEMKKVIKITADQVSGRATVLAGTAATTTEKSIEFSQFAASVGMDGVMIVPPYYCLPTERELHEHYKSIAESINILVMIYNNPKRAGIDLSPEWLSKIASEIDNISFVKDSSGDPKRVQQIISLANGNLTVFTGNDDLSLHALVVGAKGWIAASASIVPEMALSLVQAVEEGNLEKAREFFYRLLPLFSFVGRSRKFVQVSKAGLEMRDHAGGMPRKPRLPLTREEETELRKLLENLELL
ncbi:MAG: 4-hydroxy-tetrahydrodipicolinate synthase [Candidatus Aenigmarchaeota archaeon]|nr:4-hydroxy-tetrahydrodipicolinate synthase [Candidatus Aenigmarchaeota archaeon]